MEVIKKLTEEELTHLPAESIYYFGPKKISCTELLITEHDGYCFETYKYERSGNGRMIVKMFNSNKEQLLENLTIRLDYHWWNTYRITIENDCHQISNEYFKFSQTIEKNLERVFKKLILVANKLHSYDRIIISRTQAQQYMLAYISFLFFNNNDKKISASIFSDQYKTLKKIKNLVSYVQTDHANRARLSEDNVFYKVFNRYANRQIELLKNQDIEYD